MEAHGLFASYYSINRRQYAPSIVDTPYHNGQHVYEYFKWGADRIVWYSYISYRYSSKLPVRTIRCTKYTTIPGIHTWMYIVYTVRCMYYTVPSMLDHRELTSMEVSILLMALNGMDFLRMLSSFPRQCLIQRMILRSFFTPPGLQDYLP